jgi:hypothetical protein
VDMSAFKCNLKFQVLATIYFGYDLTSCISNTYN